ncbi:unnamed protein product [Bursaphelenchus xylophilus]|uniref:(pine wood nematode) hypothetical protein n=1 Tax=Bursaphelenchus xylophilus TaxID=6326 RepID=A0A1I7S239_BURXY|nr:unnamed protein product [Bursaphelenchus xylophilus]CAG9114943.1 unnamed protein product [Bursaphelenchus xylophilus]
MKPDLHRCIIFSADEFTEPWAAENQKIGLSDCYQPKDSEIVCCPEAMKNTLKAFQRSMKKLGKPSEEEDLKVYSAKINAELGSHYPITLRKAGPTYSLHIEHEKLCGIHREYGKFEPRNTFIYRQNTRATMRSLKFLILILLPFAANAFECQEKRNYVWAKELQYHGLNLTLSLSEFDPKLLLDEDLSELVEDNDLTPVVEKVLRQEKERFRFLVEEFISSRGIDVEKKLYNSSILAELLGYSSISRCHYIENRVLCDNFVKRIMSIIEKSAKDRLESLEKIVSGEELPIVANKTLASIASDRYGGHAVEINLDLEQITVQENQLNLRYKVASGARFYAYCKNSGFLNIFMGSGDRICDGKDCQKVGVCRQSGDYYICQ